jgi:LPXTG-motif cell wall-anchored protein
VTFTENAPPAISGATWSAPVFSPKTVKIGDGTTVPVTLTNTLDEIPDPTLASTGSDLAPWIALAAVAMVAGLSMLIVIRRRSA